jgi:DNA-directed RNA polymerase subunit M/transcription elongation factor TFIIS
MISRWDARVSLVAREGYETLPTSIVFRCERCGSTEFYRFDPQIRKLNCPAEGPRDISQTICLKCVRCGMIEATITRTILLGNTPG